MSLRKQKSPNGFLRQTPGDHFGPCIAWGANGGVDLDTRTHRVRFMMDLPTRELPPECGDSPDASPRIRFKNIQTILKGNLENEREVPELELSLSEWDIGSEGTDLQNVSGEL